MSSPTTCVGSRNAISSPASACGAMPYDSPDGRMIDLCGQVLALASLSASQVQLAGLMTSGTFGPPGISSSKTGTPPVVFGEQVEAAIKHGWLDLVHADMEGTGYTFAAVDLCAAGVGAPHIRQRLWFVAERLADTADSRRDQGRPGVTSKERDGAARNGATGRVGDDDEGLEGFRGGHQTESGRLGAVRPTAEAGELGGVADASAGGFRVDRSTPREAGHTAQRDATEQRSCPTNGHWRDADWLFCRDGKWRPVEPGTFPLAHGAAARVGRLRAYGNAIVAQAAEAVIRSFMEVRP